MHDFNIYTHTHNTPTEIRRPAKYFCTTKRPIIMPNTYICYQVLVTK